MDALDFAEEMAASRMRRETATAGAIRASRVLAVRTALRPGSKDEDIEATILHFYPKLSAEKREDVATAVRMRGFGGVSVAPAIPQADEPAPVEIEATAGA
jgi:hypothetical protein